MHILVFINNKLEPHNGNWVIYIQHSAILLSKFFNIQLWLRNRTVAFVGLSSENDQKYIEREIRHFVKILQSGTGLTKLIMELELKPETIRWQKMLLSVILTILILSHYNKTRHRWNGCYIYSRHKLEGSEQNIRLINIMQVTLEETICFRTRIAYVFDCPFENRTLK